jgi:hypothetical protein
MYYAITQLVSMAQMLEVNLYSIETRALDDVPVQFEPILTKWQMDVYILG